MAETKLRFPSVHSSDKAGSNDHGEHSVHDAILDELQNRISQGGRLPGERLPSIAQLAKEFHAGTGSIRQVLPALQSIGFVKIEHGSGVYVTETQPITGLTSHFHDVGAGLNLALAETRCVLEPELAALAAKRGTDAELCEIEELVRQMEAEAQNGQDFADLDVQFHRQIARAARNPILLQTMEGVSDLFLHSRRTILLDPNASLRALRYHALIADALRTRNAPQARLSMQGHMNSMMDELMASENSKQSMENNLKTSEESI